VENDQAKTIVVSLLFSGTVSTDNVMQRRMNLNGGSKRFNRE
jgi:hypothetical protein